MAAINFLVYLICTVLMLVANSRATMEPTLNEPEHHRVINHLNDQQPYFINFPMPMQAVVPLNATPGTFVYRLHARCSNTDHDIHYFLVRDETGDDRFEVDELSGEVLTLGSDPFVLDKEYILYVRAEDHSSLMEDGNHSSTSEERVSIRGGKRPPQFYFETYETTIPENQSKNLDIIEVKAKSFNNKEIKYILRHVGFGAGTFKIDPTTARVRLVKDLDYENHQQRKRFWVLVTGTEDSGGLSTSVELIINVTDANDNVPIFELPTYNVYDVDENVAVGTSILRVKAWDWDTGNNSEIDYSLINNDFWMDDYGIIYPNKRLDPNINYAKIEYSLDDEFRIDNKGIIYSNTRLDASMNNAYVLTVMATDRGDPPLTGTATVCIYMKKRISEPPRFSTDLSTPNINENAGPNTTVTTGVSEIFQAEKMTGDLANSGGCSNRKPCSGYFKSKLGIYLLGTILFLFHK